MRLIVVSIIVCLSTLNVAAQKANVMEGTWGGKIESGGQVFRMVFHVKSGDKGPTCTLDSPDQGALNLPVKGISFSGRLLVVDASNMSAMYKGAMQTGDSVILGNWIQDGVAFTLNLSKQAERIKPNRPQEPVAPFPYSASEVTINNMAGRATLSSTLVIPKGSGPFPAVVLVSDVGSHNRDGEVLGHRPLWVIADYLARNGVASIRFDDRGVGKSTGNFKAATTNDFAADVEECLRLLYTHAKVSKKKVGIVGHGEGGVVAAMVAKEDSKVAFVVLLAAFGINGEELLCDQASAISKASGLPESATRESEQINRAMYDIVKSELDNQKAVDKLTSYAWAVAKSQQSLTDKEQQAMVGSISKSFSSLISPWYRNFLVLNPAAYYSKLKIPVLALCGGRDLEVNADKNLKTIEDALREGGNANFRVLKLDDLNHLFQHCRTGLPGEYGTIEETISPDVLRIMTDWIKSEVVIPHVK